MVDAGTVVGDQPELRPGLGQQPGIDAVGDRANQHARVNQLRLGHGLVVQVELDVEQLHHPGFDGIGQLAGHHHARSILPHGFLPFLSGAS